MEDLPLEEYLTVRAEKNLVSEKKIIKTRFF